MPQEKTKQMSQSLSQIYIHLIFGTKYREPLITPTIENELHAYMSSIFRKWESPAIAINNVPDHIHILFRLSKNYALAKVIEEVKKNSSKWIKTKGLNSFKWQTGYGAFSVSSSKVDTVISYIQNQKAHHNKISFRTEVEKFLQEYDIVEYNPDYFWED